MSLVVPLARGMPWRIRETIARLREHGSRSVITFSHGMQLVNRLRLVSGLFSSVVWLFSFVSHMYMYLWSLFRTPRMQEIHLQPRPHATVQSQAGLAAEGRGWLRRNLGLNFWGFGHHRVRCGAPGDFFASYKTHFHAKKHVPMCYDVQYE